MTSPAASPSAAAQVPKVVDIDEYKLDVDVDRDRSIALISCEDSLIEDELRIFEELTSQGDATSLSDRIIANRDTIPLTSHLAISNSIITSDITSISVDSSSGTTMARTKQTTRKSRDVKDSAIGKSAKEFTCFICGFKCTVLCNFRRYLARKNWKKEDGTDADEE